MPSSQRGTHTTINKVGGRAGGASGNDGGAGTEGGGGWWPGGDGVEGRSGRSVAPVPRLSN